MKKIYFLAAMTIVAAGFTVCGNSAPREDLKSDIDSLSYAFDTDQGQSAKQYLQQMQTDTAHIDEFIKGINDGAQNTDDKKHAIYNAGIGAGIQTNMAIKNQINRQIFGEDSTKSVSLANFLAGFAASAKGHDQKATVEWAREVKQKTPRAIQIKTAEETYGANKKKSDAYIAANAKKEDMKTIGQGVQVKELEAGLGATPKASDIAKINCVSKAIDGRVFDQRDGATMPVGGIIPGFIGALTKMPADAKWEITIPYTAGCSAEQPGPGLRPFPTLIFTTELSGIEKAPEGQPDMPRGMSVTPQGKSGM